MGIQGEEMLTLSCGVLSTRAQSWSWLLAIWEALPRLRCLYLLAFHHSTSASFTLGSRDSEVAVDWPQGKPKNTEVDSLSLLQGIFLI